MWDVNQWWTQKTEKTQAGKPFILNWLVTDLTIELLIITVPANIINITYLIYCYWASAQSLHIQTLLMYFPLFSCPCFSTSASNESVTGALHLTQVGTKFTNDLHLIRRVKMLSAFLTVYDFAERQGYKYWHYH